MRLSRTKANGLPGKDASGQGGEPAWHDTAQIAEDLGMAALDLAQKARAAGLTTLAYLFESAALEAGAEAAAARWPSDEVRDADTSEPQQNAGIARRRLKAPRSR
jgi:hypothetical protein